MKRLLIAASAAGLAFSSVSQAFEVFTDYTPSTEIWNVTMVKVNPNRIDDYLEGLKQTWITGCEAGKKHGTVVDCYAYLSDTAANSDFNMLLVVKFPNAASQDPNPERYKAFMADLRAMIAEDKQNQLVEGYEELRTFHGEQNFRRINFK
jgi:hypothetical protein